MDRVKLTFNYYDMVIYAARDSSSARTLANVLGARRWREGLYSRYQRRRPFFRGNNSPIIVNWGSTIRPEWLEDRRFGIRPSFVNGFDKVACAVDKLKFFQAIAVYNGGIKDRSLRIPTLKWTGNKEDCRAWSGGGHKTVVRQTTTASSGRGMHIVAQQEEIPTAPLYTKYYPKTHEFRVHVFRQTVPSGASLPGVPGVHGYKVIDLTEKRNRVFEGQPDMEAILKVNRIIRSHENGWVHSHRITPMQPGDLDKIKTASIRAVGALGLDFGAVDVLAILGPPEPLIGGLNDHEEAPIVRPLKSFKICEVNTAPGLENEATITAYSKAILETYTEIKGGA